MRKNEEFQFHFNQQAERLERCGYIEMAANKNYFNKYLEGLKKKFPALKYVDKTGRFALTQIIYLPKAKREILARLKRDKAEYEKALKSTEEAIAKMDEKTVFSVIQGGVMALAYVDSKGIWRNSAHREIPEPEEKAVWPKNPDGTESCSCGVCSRLVKNIKKEMK